MKIPYNSIVVPGSRLHYALASLVFGILGGPICIGVPWILATKLKCDQTFDPVGCVNTEPLPWIGLCLAIAAVSISIYIAARLSRALD